MIEITRKLSDLANALDAAQMSKMASVVDGVNSRTLNIKKAQYEGIQGYWIRNRRCWENCYRQKRARTDLAAQEVWSECQQEYVDSLGKEGTSWDKYASGLRFTKTANLKKIKVVDNKFRDKVAARVKDGLDVGSAVFATIEEEGDKHFEKLIAEADKMAKVATALKSNGKEELSKVASNISEDLFKEAQFWDKVKDWGKNNIVDPLKRGPVGRGVRGLGGNANTEDVSGRLNKLLKEVQSLRTRFPSDMTSLDGQTSEFLDSEYKDLRGKVQNELVKIQDQTRNNPESGKIYQAIYPAFQQFSQAENPNSRRKALDGLGQAIGSGLSMSQSIKPQTGDEMQTDPGKAQPNSSFQNRPQIVGEDQLGPELLQQNALQQDTSSQPMLPSPGTNGGPIDLNDKEVMRDDMNPVNQDTQANPNQPVEQSQDTQEVEKTKDIIDQLSSKERQALINYLTQASNLKGRKRKDLPPGLVSKLQGAQPENTAMATSKTNDRRSVKTASFALDDAGKDFLRKLKKEYQ